LYSSIEAPLATASLSVAENWIPAPGVKAEDSLFSNAPS
jgi:hypothetical protein